MPDMREIPAPTTFEGNPADISIWRVFRADYKCHAYLVFGSLALLVVMVALCVELYDEHLHGPITTMPPVEMLYIAGCWIGFLVLVWSYRIARIRALLRSGRIVEGKIKRKIVIQGRERSIKYQFGFFFEGKSISGEMQTRYGSSQAARLDEGHRVGICMSPSNPKKSVILDLF